VKKKKPAVGLTGEDLYREYMLGKWNSNLTVIKIISWIDAKALFQRPALCLIGPEQKSLDEYYGKVKVCISSKYCNLAKRYLNTLEGRGFVFEKSYLNGSVETSCALGLSDLAIDIVYTGSSIRQYNLKIYDKICESNFVIVGGKNDKELQL
jgi:ATP phosphoribosyltransferase